MTDKELLQNIGIELKVIRTRLKQTQLQASENIGISEDYLSDIETGRRSVSLSFLNTILMYYGVSFTNFFAQVEQEN